MNQQEKEIERGASLPSAAEPEMCKDCEKAFYQHIANRADLLCDSVLDYESEWINTLNLDADKFFKAEFEEQQRIAKLLPHYGILDDFIMAEVALSSIREKLSAKNAFKVKT